MSKRSKRELKIRENPKNVSLDDFEWMVSQYGYTRPGGNHVLAVIGGRTFPYKRTNPVHPPYVRKLIELIDGL